MENSNKSKGGLTETIEERLDPEQLEKLNQLRQKVFEGPQQKEKIGDGDPLTQREVTKEIKEVGKPMTSDASSGQGQEPREDLETGGNGKEGGMAEENISTQEGGGGPLGDLELFQQVAFGGEGAREQTLLQEVAFGGEGAREQARRESESEVEGRSSSGEQEGPSEIEVLQAGAGAGEEEMRGDGHTDKIKAKVVPRLARLRQQAGISEEEKNSIASMKDRIIKAGAVDKGDKKRDVVKKIIETGEFPYERKEEEKENVDERDVAEKEGEGKKVVGEKKSEESPSLRQSQEFEQPSKKRLESWKMNTRNLLDKRNKLKSEIEDIDKQLQQVETEIKQAEQEQMLENTAKLLDQLLTNIGIKDLPKDHLKELAELQMRITKKQEKYLKEEQKLRERLKKGTGEGDVEFYRDKYRDEYEKMKFNLFRDLNSLLTKHFTDNKGAIERGRAFLIEYMQQNFIQPAAENLNGIRYQNLEPKDQSLFKEIMSRFKQKSLWKRAMVFGGVFGLGAVLTPGSVPAAVLAGVTTGGSVALRAAVGGAIGGGIAKWLVSGRADKWLEKKLIREKKNFGTTFTPEALYNMEAFREFIRTQQEDFEKYIRSREKKRKWLRNVLIALGAGTGIATGILTSRAATNISKILFADASTHTPLAGWLDHHNAGDSAGGVGESVTHATQGTHIPTDMTPETPIPTHPVPTDLGTNISETAETPQSVVNPSTEAVKVSEAGAGGVGAEHIAAAQGHISQAAGELLKPEVLDIGKTGPVGALQEYFLHNKEVAERFGWNGTENIENFAYRTFLEHTKGMGYTEDMIRHIDHGKVIVDPTAKTIGIEAEFMKHMHTGAEAGAGGEHLLQNYERPPGEATGEIKNYEAPPGNTGGGDVVSSSERQASVGIRSYERPDELTSASAGNEAGQVPLPPSPPTTEVIPPYHNNPVEMLLDRFKAAGIGIDPKNYAKEIKVLSGTTVEQLLRATKNATASVVDIFNDLSNYPPPLKGMSDAPEIARQLELARLFSEAVKENPWLKDLSVPEALEKMGGKF